MKSDRVINNTIEILKPIIPETDLSDAGYMRLHPGGIAKPCIETLKNGAVQLDERFWIWQYRKQGELPNFAWEGTRT